MAEQLEVSLTPIKQCNLPLLQEQWLELEEQANNAIFTHWPYINTWLEYINYQGNILTVSESGKPVGLAIVVEKTIYKSGIKIQQLWLNRTGDSKLDQIWSEYNDILCCKGLEYSIRAAVIDFFAENLNQYDEFIMGVCNENIQETPCPDNITQHTSWRAISYKTKLRSEFKDWLKYLSTLSANSRAQIKRSAKLFGGIENILISKAKNLEEALCFFNEAGEIHKIRWMNQNSGFENDDFIRFHQAFIKKYFHTKSIDLLKFEANGKTICYLYNFLYNNTVYFYLSGIHYDTDNRLKPGLLAHSLAISHYAALGFDTYDFMGGEGRYKKSLSNNQGMFIISNFRRKTLPFVVSYGLNNLMSFVRKYQQHD